MDRADATALLEALRLAPLEGCVVEELLGHGVSAAVYRATDDQERPVALKVFDAWASDAKRVDRQLRLKGHECPNLVQIYGGGIAEIGGKQRAFQTMELIEGEDMTALVTAERRPDDPVIRTYLLQLCRAAKFLLDHEFCHRDIKTANIRVRRGTGEVVLLDVGVVVEVGSAGEVTDRDDGKPFVGTRRYAPPEFLHRREADDAAGWEAVTVYQVGAVLYELIHGAPLFGHVRDQPQADLIVAVNELIPPVMRSDVGGDLLAICRRCLEKEPQRRPKLGELDVVASSARLPAVDQTFAARHIASAQERHRTRIEPLEKRMREQREAAAKALRETDAIVLAALKCLSVAQGAHASNGPGPGDSCARLLTVSEMLENGMLGHLQLLILFTVHPITADTLVRGVAMDTEQFFTVGPDKIASLAEIPAVQAQLETIWNATFEPQGLRGDVSSWLERIVDAHLRRMAPRYEAWSVHEESARAAKLVGRPVPFFEKEEGFFCFNTVGRARFHQPIR